MVSPFPWEDSEGRTRKWRGTWFILGINKAGESNQKKKKKAGENKYLKDFLMIIERLQFYLGNFLFNLQLAKILDVQILQLNFFFFSRVVNNFFQGGPQPM